MTTTKHEAEISASDKVPTITITREFDAPRELVYRAHVDPELYTQWIGPHGMATNVGTWEPRRGGAWSFTNLRNGEEIASFYGSFHDVREAELIVWTFTWEGAPDEVALERLRFEELPGGRTRLTISSVVDSFETRDAILASGMETGVKDGYEKLDALLETMR